MEELQEQMLHSYLCFGICGVEYNEETGTYRNLSFAEIDELQQREDVEKEIKDIPFDVIRQKWEEVNKFRDEKSKEVHNKMVKFFEDISEHAQRVIEQNRKEY